MVNFCLYKTLIFPIFTCVESDPHSEHGSGSTKLLNIRIQLGSGSQKQLNTDPTLIRIPKVAEYGSYEDPDPHSCWIRILQYLVYLHWRETSSPSSTSRLSLSLFPTTSPATERERYLYTYLSGLGAQSCTPATREDRTWWDGLGLPGLSSLVGRWINIRTLSLYRWLLGQSQREYMQHCLSRPFTFLKFAGSNPSRGGNLMHQGIQTKFSNNKYCKQWCIVITIHVSCTNMWKIE